MIFVDGTPVEARNGDSIVASIQRLRPDVATELRSGGRALTDSRGLPIPPDSPAYAGAIVRVVSARAARVAAEASAADALDSDADI